MEYINTNKLKKLRIDKNNIFIVLDFDRTITNFNSQDSWAVCGGLLGDKFKKRMDEYYNYYFPIEIDYKIDEKEKESYMIEWYDKCINLYYEFDLTKKKLEQSIRQSKITFREGAKEFIKKANINNIPIVILSAGIGNVIEEFLKINDYYFDNIYIISNFIKFNDNGNMKKFNDKMIHTLNKTMEGHLSKEFKEKIDKKEIGLLVGDLISDIKMISKDRLESAVTIGFLNDNNNLEVYNKNFDIVLDKEDATFENVEKLVFKNVSL